MVQLQIREYNSLPEGRSLALIRPISNTAKITMKHVREKFEMRFDNKKCETKTIPRLRTGDDSKVKV